VPVPKLTLPAPIKTIFVIVGSLPGSLDHRLSRQPLNCGEGKVVTYIGAKRSNAPLLCLRGYAIHFK
jgi:hypothetical protein